MPPKTPKNPARSLTAPKGFRAAAATAGIKASGRPDLALIAADGPCTAAGVFTTNRVLGAPVIVGKAHLRGGRARAILCNSGNSNVATGPRGLADAKTMCAAAADALGCKPSDVLPASTGIIGRPLPIKKITAAVPGLAASLAAGPKADAAAATAILTTDLVVKSAVRAGVTRRAITFGGIAKGSGMIAPSMATMLAFLTTDAAVAAPVLRLALREAAAATFNRVSVDTDQSTSDTVYLLASGASGTRPITAPTGVRYRAFVNVLTDLCAELAERIVRDGEGATRVFRVAVSGATSVRDADRVGRAVAESPLVKTAVHGADPNWGRIAMAAGKSGAALNPDRLRISVNGEPVFRDGVPVPMTPAFEKKLSASMQKGDVLIGLELRLGNAGCTWWGCDLSRAYITINADYTT